MILTKKTTSTDDVEIEYSVSHKVNNQPTLILSLGIWEPAARALPLITRLPDVHCIVLSYRGRGRSTTPANGFDWQHHASDLAAVLRVEPVNKPIFLGFSKGVSYLLGYLSLNAIIPAALILIDYPAIHIKATAGYADFWYSMEYNGSRLGNFISRLALDGIERESSPAEFYPYLSHQNCPIWVFRGNNPASPIPSNLNNDDITRYQHSIKNLHIIDFNYSGHMILDEELGKAVKHIQHILNVTGCST